MSAITTQWINILRGKSVKDKQIRSAYLFILPAVVYFSLNYLVPFIFDLYMTVFRFSFTGKYEFAGLEIFRGVWNDKLFWTSLKVTFNLGLLSVPAVMALSLLVAVILEEFVGSLAKNLYRAVYFLPVVTSGVAIAFVWSWLFEPSPQVGLINIMLAQLGFAPHMWLNSVKEVLPAIAIMNIWARLGFDMIIFLAGLQTIPQEFYEAARLDGANRVQSFLHITLPLLNPQIAMVAIYEIINVLKTFDIPYIATAGGPANASRVVVLHIYDKAFRWNEINEATVAGLVLFILILAITLIQWRFLNRPVEY